MTVAGLIFIGALTHFDVKGAILMGVVSVSVVVWGYPLDFQKYTRCCTPEIYN
jgi:xanthine/uracil/vitamin C permease (AzgA family)